jgi:hypothetical protein
MALCITHCFYLLRIFLYHTNLLPTETFDVHVSLTTFASVYVQTDQQSRYNKQERKTKLWHCWIQSWTVSCLIIILLEFMWCIYY